MAWRPHQLQLLEWFRKEAPSLGQPYEAAVILMGDVSFPARVHLICHIVRDIYTKLPEILDGRHRRREPSMEYPDSIDKLIQPWAPYIGDSLASAGRVGTDPETAAIVMVSQLAVHQVQELLKLRQELKNQPSSAQVLAQALYRRFVEAGFNPPERLVRAFEKERRWFTERAHLVRDADKLPTDDGLLEHFRAFEKTLHSLVAPYFTVQQDFDAILQQANQ